MSLAGLEDELRSSVDTAVDYLRSSWDRFANMSPEIIDLQHRAAVVAYNAKQAGDTQRADQAQAVIRALGTLNVKHGQALDTMRSVASFVGIGGLSGYTGLGLVIPAAQVTVITSLALVVLWAFRAYAAESRKLDLLEQGVLTPEEFRQLDPGPAPSMLFAGVTNVAKLAVAGLALYVVLQLVPQFTGRARARRNPPLVVFERNPPADVIGEEVLAVWYRHAQDGKAYVHKFGDDVELLAEPDGSVRLEHRGGLDLWSDFDVEEGDDDEDDLEELPEGLEEDELEDGDDSDDDDEDDDYDDGDVEEDETW